VSGKRGKKEICCITRGEKRGKEDRGRRRGELKVGNGNEISLKNAPDRAVTI